MKQVKAIVSILLWLAVSFAVFGQDVQDIMEQYKQMGEGTAKNFPKDLEVLMPKEFAIQNKSFIFKETANMFLLAALGGSRKNDVYPKFGHEAAIEVGVMAYNPQSASHVGAQFPVMIEEKKKAYRQNLINEGGGWEKGPVAVSKINEADVFIQKGIRKNVEIDNFKHEDQVYYFAEVVQAHKNVMLTIRIIYYPLKGENVTEAVKAITKTFLATDFNKYMK